MKIITSKNKLLHEKPAYLENWHGARNTKTSKNWLKCVSKS